MSMVDSLPVCLVSILTEEKSIYAQSLLQFLEYMISAHVYLDHFQYQSFSNSLDGRTVVNSLCHVYKVASILHVPYLLQHTANVAGIYSHLAELLSIHQHLQHFWL